MPARHEHKRDALLSRLGESANRQLVYVIGGIDSGKTTLCRFLADRLSARFPTALINCDPGQAAVGPPACLGMALCRGKRTLSVLRFIGSTSPFGHMLPILNGSGRLRDKAVEWGARKIVVDSSGFVYGPAGMAFQFETIDLLQPDVIVGIEANTEQRRSLEELIRNFRGGNIEYCALPVHPAVKKRPAEERLAYREAMFRSYFQNARPRAMSFRRMGLHGRIPNGKNDEIISGRLIALSDNQHFVITLGIIESLDMNRSVIQFQSPPFAKKSVTTLDFGALCVDLAGKHSPPSR